MNCSALTRLKRNLLGWRCLYHTGSVGIKLNKISLKCPSLLWKNKKLFPMSIVPSKQTKGKCFQKPKRPEYIIYPGLCHLSLLSLVLWVKHSYLLLPWYLPGHTLYMEAFCIVHAYNMAVSSSSQPNCGILWSLLNENPHYFACWRRSRHMCRNRVVVLV